MSYLVIETVLTAAALLLLVRVVAGASRCGLLRVSTAHLTALELL